MDGWMNWSSSLLAQDLLLINPDNVYVTTMVIPDLFKLTYLKHDLACALRSISSNSGVYLDWILMLIWYDWGDSDWAGCSGLETCVLFLLDGSMNGSMNTCSITCCSFPCGIQGRWMCHPPHAGFLSPPSHSMLTPESYSSDLGYKKISVSPCTVETCFKDLTQGPKSCCRCHHHHETLLGLLYNKSRGQLRQDLPWLLRQHLKHNSIIACAQK